MTEFVITYPTSYMKLNLEKAFEVDLKGRLSKIYKKDFYKIMLLVKEHCTPEQKEFLYDWLTKNAPKLAEEFTKNFSRIKK